MKKIKVLEKNQIELARLGIYCHQSIEPSNEFDKFASTIYILVLMAISLVASACYVHENLSINVRLALNAAIMVPATLQWIGVYLGFRLKTNQIQDFHLKLQGIIDEGKIPHILFEIRVISMCISRDR